jgi:hypothetical protein
MQFVLDDEARRPSELLRLSANDSSSEERTRIRPIRNDGEFVGRRNHKGRRMTVNALVDDFDRQPSLKILSAKTAAAVGAM